MALTYQLEVEANGTEHLKVEPQMKKSVVVGPRPPGPDKVEKIAGFYMPKSDDKKEDDEMEQLADQVSEVVVNEEEEEEFSDVEEEEEEEEDDDDDGWITPGNIQQVKHSMNGVLETIQLEVACISTDFAMQVFYLHNYFTILNKNKQNYI